MNSIRSTYETIRGLVREFGPEALRACLSSMVPAFLLGYFYDIALAVPFMIGALNASMTDFPGLRRDKVQVALWGIFWTILTASTVGMLLDHPFWLIGLITLMAILYTLFGALGSRIGMVGVTSLFMITFTLGLRPEDPLLFALFAGLGTLFYHVVSILHARIIPSREIRRVINTCFYTTADLLRVKARCYEAGVPVDKLHKQIAAISVRVAEQHETIRYLLLQDRQKYSDNEDTNYAIWLQAYLLMDLYSMVTAVDRDYTEIRKSLSNVNALRPVQRLIETIADAVEKAADPNWREPSTYGRFMSRIEAQLRELKAFIIDNPGPAGTILHDIIANTEGFVRSIEQLHTLDGDQLVTRLFNKNLDYDAFLSTVSLSIKDIWKHVQSYSPLFYFSLRMGLLFLTGGVIGYLLSGMVYSYWIFMTIIVVARPSFSVTVSRNKQRLFGTLIGVLLGFLIISLFSNVYVTLFLTGFLMFCFLLFNRRYYLVSVIFITASVIAVFHLTDDTFEFISGSRILFTLIGCALSVASWYIFPVKLESDIKSLAKKALSENDLFLEAINTYLQSPDDATRYQVRLARKRAFMVLAKLSDTCMQAQKEPHSAPQIKRLISEVHMQFYRYHAMISNLWLHQGQIDNASEPLQQRLNRMTALRQYLERTLGGGVLA